MHDITKISPGLVWCHDGVIYSEQKTDSQIGTLLQNVKSCHQVAAQMHVSYSTVQRCYSSVKDSLPKHPGGHPRQLIANDQCLLAQRVTSGAADTASQLMRLSGLNVILQTVMTAQERQVSRLS